LHERTIPNEKAARRYKARGGRKKLEKEVRSAKAWLGLAWLGDQNDSFPELVV
jgi:hypothetical protein